MTNDKKQFLDNLYIAVAASVAGHAMASQFNPSEPTNILDMARFAADAGDAVACALILEFSSQPEFEEWVQSHRPAQGSDEENPFESIRCGRD